MTAIDPSAFEAVSVCRSTLRECLRTPSLAPPASPPSPHARYARRASASVSGKKEKTARTHTRQVRTRRVICTHPPSFRSSSRLRRKPNFWLTESRSTPIFSIHPPPAARPVFWLLYKKRNQTKVGKNDIEVNLKAPRGLWEHSSSLREAHAGGKHRLPRTGATCSTGTQLLCWRGGTRQQRGDILPLQIITRCIEYSPRVISFVPHTGSDGGRFIWLISQFVIPSLHSVGINKKENAIRHRCPRGQV